RRSRNGGPTYLSLRRLPISQQSGSALRGGDACRLMAPGDGSPLALDPEAMRRLGYRTIDMLVDRISAPPGPVVRTATPLDLHERIAMRPPEEPAPFEEIVAGPARDVLPFVARISHPGYLAFIPCEGTWPG